MTGRIHAALGCVWSIGVILAAASVGAGEFRNARVPVVDPTTDGKILSFDAPAHIFAARPGFEHLVLKQANAALRGVRKAGQVRIFASGFGSPTD